MQFYKVFGIVATAYLAIAILLLAYLRWALARQKVRNNTRMVELKSSPKFQALSPDNQLTFLGYLFRSMVKSGQKRIIFEAIRLTSILIGGGAPILSSMTDSPTLQKSLNAITTIAALTVGALSVDKFLVEHRRAAYLIEGLINEWRSNTGSFADVEGVEAFQLLIGKTKEILDTAETSFIGASSARPPEHPAISHPESIPMAPPSKVQPGRVAPEDFASWQQAAIDESEDPITQF